jgi:iron complex outermembrane receptor protein
VSRNRLWQSLWIAGTAALVAVAPVRADTSAITDVRVETSADGLQLILEFDGEETPQIFSSASGNTLIVDILNTRLRLADGDRFSADNPNEAIAEIAVSPLDENNVRLIVTSQSGQPAIEWNEAGGALIFQVTTAEVETPTLPNLSTDPSAEGDARPDDIIEILVTATRNLERLTDVPRSTSVIEQEQIEEQMRVTRDLGTILSQEVPGLSPPTQSASNFGQTLRGRNISVLIDGIPQSTNRNVARDLRTIDPGAIERVEVLRGPTAIYGDGATGGIINIITKQGRGEGITAQSWLDLNAFPSDFGDSLSPTIQQSVSGRLGKIDIALNASYTGVNGLFDGDGDRIPPDPNAQGGLADTTTLNVSSKLGYNFTEDQRLQLLFNYFHDDQDTNYATDPIVNELPGRQKARALSGLELDNSQQTDNLLVSLDYTNDNLLGSRLHAQTYYRDYFTRFFPFDAREFPSLGNTIFQSQVESEKYGGRLQLNTPLFGEENGNLLWGVDYVRESTNQPVDIFDPEVFENSDGLVYRRIGDRTWSPLQRQDNLGLFAQLKVNLGEKVVLRGGVRHERINIDVDDYTTIAGDAIEGGELDYNATLFNVGGVVYPTDEISVFANFSQGFSIADVGRVLRGASAGFSVEELDPEAQTVDNYEIGIRANYEKVRASLSGFYNTSDLGSTFTQDFQVVRAPERVYGVEFALDVTPSEKWAFGGTFTWTDGAVDLEDNGDYDDPLNGFRISPIKVTAYVENETLPGWNNRLQALYSGSRDPEGQGFGLGEVDSYITLDLISSLQVGPGRFVLGVENLLDTQYFPVVSQLQGQDTAYAAARGRTLRLGYSLSW